MEFSAVLTGTYLEWFITGAKISLVLFLSASVLAFIIALLLVAVRSTGFRPAVWLVQAFVEYHRNVPLLVHMLFWYFAVVQILPMAVQIWINQRSAEFYFAMLALALNYSAYMSEDIRSGLRSLHKGQIEAARALGLNYIQTMRDVILPQAVRIALPPLVGQSLNLFKATSIAMAIGVADMAYSARWVDNATYLTFEAFAVATVFYLVVSSLIIALGSIASKRWRLQT